MAAVVLGAAAALAACAQTTSGTPVARLDGATGGAPGVVPTQRVPVPAGSVTISRTGTDAETAFRAYAGAVAFHDRIAHVWTGDGDYLVAVHVKAPGGGLAAAATVLTADFEVRIL
jgi:hypothetical protein